MKFAHIADAHIGAFSKNPELAECNIRAFEKAMDMCIEEQVDFVIIAGDLFHNPVPDLAMAERAVRAMRRVSERGIRIYVVYGSHDFSAGTTSMLDIIASTRIFDKAVSYEVINDKIVLKPVVDDTGVSIVGITGLTASREIEYFDRGLIDMEALESIPHPKIFVFHTTVQELKPGYIREPKSVPKSKFPRGFDYYAGGHLHSNIVSDYDGAPMIYPGPLFGATYNDLKGNMERGFYIVEDFKPRFVRVDVCDVEKKEFRADGKSAGELEDELMGYAEQDHGGRVVILKVSGKLKHGAVGDIDFSRIRREIKKTAREVLITKYSLSSASDGAAKVSVSEGEDIEEKQFAEISDYGIDFTKRLFSILREEKKDGETRSDYENRLWESVYSLILELHEREREKEGTGDKDNAKPEEKKRDEDEKRKRAQRGRTLFDFGGDAL